MGLAALPRRDAESREHLDRLGDRVRPLVLAQDRCIPLHGRLGDLVPRGALTRGSVLRVDGGSGATSTAFGLAAAVTSLGEWAAAVDLDGTLGALAAAEAGVVLERFAVVRRVPPARWATVLAALLDGVSLVLAEVPRGVTLGEARRLAARARERETVLVVHERVGAGVAVAVAVAAGAGAGAAAGVAAGAGAAAGVWPAEAALTLHAVGSAWSDPAAVGHLAERTLHVRVEGRGVQAQPDPARADGELARAV